MIAINWSEQLLPIFPEYLNIDYNIIHNIIILFVTCSVISIFYYVIKSFKIEHEKIINEIEEKNSRKLDNELKKQMHDFKNHLGTLSIMLEMEKVKKAKNYLKEITGEIKILQQQIKTGNQVINSLLHSKMIKAKNNNISLNIKSTGSLANLKVNDLDLNRILGNLINNAIEALKKIDINAKKIDIIIKNENQTSIEVKTYDILIPDEIEDNIFKEGFTYKKEEGHGLGLSICKQLTEKYQGNIYIEKDSSIPYTSFIVSFSA